MEQCIVLKFGGTSVGSAERIKSLPGIILPFTKEYRKVIVVCSAMSEVTDLLIKTGQDAAARKHDYESGFHEILIRHYHLVKKINPRKTRNRGIF